MTPEEQVRVAWAINSLYPGQPALDPCWAVLDRLFIPQDPGLPVAQTIRDSISGKLARVWRGSQTGWDWRADFTFLPTPSPFGVGQTETGFTAYYSNAKTESGRPLEPVDWVGGHSLGGPAATYDGCVSGTGAGAEILLAETPEPGDNVFSEWATPRFAAIHRWENPDDGVTDAPGRWLGYADLRGPATPIDMRPLRLPPWNPLKPLQWAADNHHLPNCIVAYRIANNLP
jgi:hypothetical protein